MPSEYGEAAENAHEVIKEELHGKNESDHSEEIKWVALTTMIMALLSAMGALFAGITANESLLERTEEILEISSLESDRLHIEVLRSKHEILRSLGETPSDSDMERIRAYEVEARELKTAAEKEEKMARLAYFKHEVFAIGVTLLSVAITLGGMSIIVNRRILWIVGIFLGVGGCGFVGAGVYYILF
jgi:hypothetical protein